MAQVKECLKRLSRLSRNCCSVHSALRRQISSLTIREASYNERFVLATLPTSFSQCRHLCVRPLTSDKTKNISADTKIVTENSISVTDARDIALHSLLQSISMSELLQQLNRLLQKRKNKFLTKDELEICQAYFERLAEMVTENPELKGEKAAELLKEPLFQEISQFFEEKQILNGQFVTGIMSSLLKMFSEDVLIIKSIETSFLPKIKSIAKVSFLEEMVAIHEKHQETGLRKLIYQSAVRRLEELSQPDNGVALKQHFPWVKLMNEDANSPAILEMQGQVLMNADKLNLGDVSKALCLLASKKIRNKPLIDVLVYRLKNSELHYTINGLKNLLFACSELSISDHNLMKRISQNLSLLLRSINESDGKHLYPILISCSRLNWKDNDVVKSLVNEILVLLSLGKLETDKLSSVMISLGHLNWGENDIIIDSVLENQKPLQKDAVQWLNIVWSLVILKKRLADTVPGILTKEFLQQIEDTVKDKPEYVKTGVHTKLLNIAGCSRLELNNEMKPDGYDRWMEDYKKMHQDAASSLQKSVEMALQGLKPVSITSNQVTDYGYILDYEIQLSLDGKDTDKKVGKFGLKILDYKDMLRTPDIPEPDGRNTLCLRHLEEMGYHFITVPYYEWSEQIGTEKKQQYLLEKLQSLQMVAKLHTTAPRRE